MNILKGLYVIFFIALLEPNGILYSPLHGAMGIIRYLSFFSSVLLFLQVRMYRDKISMLLIALVGWMGISTILYSGGLSDEYVNIFVTLFSSVVLSAYGIKKMPRFYILMIASILSLWLLLDGLTWKEAGTYITANGQRAFFLGTKTTITQYLMPAIAFDYVALKITKKRSYRYAEILNVMAIGGSVLYLIREPISTAIICLILALAGYVIVQRFNMLTKFICKFGFSITSGLNFMLITGNALVFLMSFFRNVLNEREGLNGRTEIWNMVLANIIRRPAVGHGYSSQIKFDVWQSYNTSTHNYFLYLLFTMGIVGFILYLMYIIILHKNNQHYLNENIHKYFMIVLTIMNIEAITESYGFNVMTFCVLVSMGYVDKLIGIKCQERKKLRFRW